MAKFTIELELDNAAFNPEPGPEVARILGDIADNICEMGLNTRTITVLLRDINGNTVGQVTIS